MAEDILDVDRVTEVYIKMRDKKAELNDQIKEIDKKMDVLESALVGHLKAQNVTSLGTTHGRVVYKIVSRYFSTDWVAMRQWTREHDAVDLFESRLHQGNTQEWLDKHPELVPPGLQSDTKEKVTVTRK